MGFFQNPKSRDFLRLLPCFVRFLELWFELNSHLATSSESALPFWKTNADRFSRICDKRSHCGKVLPQFLSELVQIVMRIWVFAPSFILGSTQPIKHS